MARVQKVDRGLSSRLEEFEKRTFVLKISYEKYFSGIDPIEPAREREELKRMLRDLQQVPVTNSRQRFQLQQLKARWGMLELYWTRNQAQIDRGTHPKQRYRADMKERQRLQNEAARAKRAALHAGATLNPDQAPDAEEAEGEAPATRPVAPRAPAPSASREDAGYRAVFDRYVELRSQCGQSTELDYGAVRESLRKQVDVLKDRYQCASVKFRVVVEDGKAKVKAVPVK